jgi:hypothetical protein
MGGSKEPYSRRWHGLWRAFGCYCIVLQVRGCRCILQQLELRLHRNAWACVSLVVFQAAGMCDAEAGQSGRGAPCHRCHPQHGLLTAPLQLYL